ncbi:hypothetical protein VTN00DRAFT_9292 [Thermoascus crustaceus]|uniref:uncharacterized protein n=1 Tax=Thermoascus crustaceus TaxID=5088 RepID=UPI003742C917
MVRETARANSSETLNAPRPGVSEEGNTYGDDNSLRDIAYMRDSTKTAGPKNGKRRSSRRSRKSNRRPAATNAGRQVVSNCSSRSRSRTRSRTRNLRVF